MGNLACPAVDMSEEVVVIVIEAVAFAAAAVVDCQVVGVVAYSGGFHLSSVSLLSDCRNV